MDITSILTGSVARAPWGWALLVAVIIAFIKVSPVLKKIASEREANLLTERAEEMDAMRARLAKLEAELRRDRHKLNNVTQCLDALLLLIELDPEKAAEGAAKVKRMRAEQVQAEAAEMAGIHTANIAGGRA